jgi:hypothetical protein
MEYWKNNFGRKPWLHFEVVMWEGSKNDLAYHLTLLEK